MLRGVKLEIKLGEVLNSYAHGCITFSATWLVNFQRSGALSALEGEAVRNSVE